MYLCGRMSIILAQFLDINCQLIIMNIKVETNERRKPKKIVKDLLMQFVATTNSPGNYKIVHPF